MRALERGVVLAAVRIVNSTKITDLPDVLRLATEAYLSDEAVKARPWAEACGEYSPGCTMSCQRPRRHPLDSDKPHEGFDRRGFRRHW